MVSTKFTYWIWQQIPKTVWYILPGVVSDFKPHLHTQDASRQERYKLSPEDVYQSQKCLSQMHVSTCIPSRTLKGRIHLATAHCVSPCKSDCNTQIDFRIGKIPPDLDHFQTESSVPPNLHACQVPWTSSTPFNSYCNDIQTFRQTCETETITSLHWRSW